MDILERFLRIFQSQSRSLVDQFDDSIKATELGIHRLKKELQSAINGLSEVRTVAARLRRDLSEETRRADDYERQAMLILKRASNGANGQSDADARALKLLNHMELARSRGRALASDLATQDGLADRLKIKVDRLRHSVNRLDNELTTLRARARTARSVQKINRQLADVDAGSTIALLEKMKQRVLEEESLAEAYGDLAEIEAELAESREDEVDEGFSAEDALADLKRRLSRGSVEAP